MRVLHAPKSEGSGSARLFLVWFRTLQKLLYELLPTSRYLGAMYGIRHMKLCLIFIVCRGGGMCPLGVAQPCVAAHGMVTHGAGMGKAHKHQKKCV